MKDHYIPEDHFPFQLDNTVFVLGNYFFNLFLVTGKTKSALFEVGVSATTDTVIRQMTELGIRPDYIIPSHPHSDHITGLPGLADRYPEAEIVVAGGAKEFVDHPKGGPLLLKEDRFISESLLRYGIQPGRAPLEKIPDLGRARSIDSKETLDLDGVKLELISVPGHSPGNLIGFLPKRRILFSSDSIGFHFPGRHFLPLFFTGAQDYVSTLSRIRKLAPDIICPAHQGPLRGKDAEAGFKESFDTTLELIKRIKISPESDERLARELFDENYKDEFTLYTRDNILNCMRLLVRRSREADNSLIR